MQPLCMLLGLQTAEKCIKTTDFKYSVEVGHVRIDMVFNNEQAFPIPTSCSISMVYVY